MEMVSSETAHGDKWAERIRRQHEALGAACPCGNHNREDPMKRYIERVTTSSEATALPALAYGEGDKPAVRLRFSSGANGQIVGVSPTLARKLAKEMLAAADDADRGVVATRMGE